MQTRVPPGSSVQFGSSLLVRCARPANRYFDICRPVHARGEFQEDEFSPDNE
jgi:hypothetical protein